MRCLRQALNGRFSLKRRSMPFAISPRCHLTVFVLFVLSSYCSPRCFFCHHLAKVTPCAPRAIPVLTLRLPPLDDAHPSLGEQPTISASDIDYVPLRYLHLPPSPAINVITASVEKQERLGSNHLDKYLMGGCIYTTGE